VSNRRFDAILIDFYGTISAGDRDAVARACRRVVGACGLTITPEELAVMWGERFFTVVDASNGEAFRLLDDCVQLSLRDTLAALGAGADASRLLSDLDSYWRNPPIYDDARAFLRAAHLPICCVSNADTDPLTTAINRNGLIFDAVVTSEETRAYKPAPAIFHRALQRVGVPPDRALHVGDSLHADVSGAAAAGLSTAWVCREDRIHDIGNSQPDFTCNRLTELIPIIGR
jgi:2-haloalkanoic acid dehalogenase type II